MTPTAITLSVLCITTAIPAALAVDQDAPRFQGKRISTAIASGPTQIMRSMPGDGVLLKAADTLATQGSVAEIQIRATTTDLIGGFGFNAEPVGYTVSVVRYDGPIFSTSWQGWDNSPRSNVRVDAACIFNEDQVSPGDHNLVTLEVAIPEDLPAGTIIPVSLTNAQFFNYDFSVPTLLPADGSITVLKTSDLDGGGTVGAEDLGELLAAWGPATGDTAADLNGDLVVDGFDLGRLLDRWGSED